MSQLSDYLENELLDHALGTGAFTMPTQVYVALFTSATSDAGGGTEVSATGTGYVRQPVDFAAASGGVANPTANVEFPEATDDYGNVTHVALVDDPDRGEGNFLWHGPLAEAKLIETGDTFRLPIADLDVSLA